MCRLVTSGTGKAISDGRLTQKQRPASERCLIWHYLGAIQQIAYAMNELGCRHQGLYSKREKYHSRRQCNYSPGERNTLESGDCLEGAAAVRIYRGFGDGQKAETFVNTTAFRTLPEDKWIITENTMKQSLQKDEYYQAQKAIRNVAPISTKPKMILL